MHSPNPDVTPNQGATPVAPDTHTHPEPLHTALSEIQQVFAARAGVTAPSTCFGIARGGDTLAEGGHGAVRFDATGAAEGYAPEPTTAYRIASCTKSFIAASILLLRDRGQLNLNDDVRQHIPEVHFVAKPGAMSLTEAAKTAAPETHPTATAGAEPAGQAASETDDPRSGFKLTGERVTLSHLLTMSAGLPTDNPWGDRQESLADDEFTALLDEGVPLATAPGTHYDYSNFGYALLGRVIERVSGRSCIEFVSGEFLATLAMNATAFDAPTLRAWHEDGDVDIAEGYTRRGDAWEHQPLTGPGAFSPIGGLFSGTADLLRWVAYLTEAFDPAVPERGPLSKASRREMQTTQRTRPPGGALPSSGYGYGLVTLDDPRYGLIAMHSGGYPGFSAHMAWHVDSRLALVAFENGTGARVGAAVIDALQTLLQAEFGSQAPLTAPPAAVRLTHPAHRSVTQPVQWPEAARAARDFDTAVRAGDLRACAGLVTENFALDQPFEQRNRALAELVGKGELVGQGVLDAPAASLAFVPGTLPAAATWRIPVTGASGMAALECSLTLAPTLPPRVQEFAIKAVPATEGQAE